MNGCRALREDEINLVLSVLKTSRDRLLFIMGLKTGFRIQELLSLQVKDVWQFNKPVDRIKVQKKHVKGGKSREVVVGPLLKEFIASYMKNRPETGGFWLFPGEGHGPLSRSQAWRVLKDAFNRLEMVGKLATHSMRKSFAVNVYEKLGYDLVLTQKALGHAHISSTLCYLPIDQDKVDEAIMSV